jgi:hypothetical protein
MTTRKRTNVQDATLKNIRVLKAKLAALTVRVKKLEQAKGRG